MLCSRPLLTLVVVSRQDDQDTSRILYRQVGVTLGTLCYQLHLAVGLARDDTIGWAWSESRGNFVEVFVLVTEEDLTKHSDISW